MNNGHCCFSGCHLDSDGICYNDTFGRMNKMLTEPSNSYEFALPEALKVCHETVDNEGDNRCLLPTEAVKTVLRSFEALSKRSGFFENRYMDVSDKLGAERARSAALEEIGFKIIKSLWSHYFTGYHVSPNQIDGWAKQLEALR